jgi:hypothetical protein
MIFITFLISGLNPEGKRMITFVIPNIIKINTHELPDKLFDKIELMEDFLIAALVESDFNETEVEVTVNDLNCLKFSIHLFCELAKKLEYIIQIKGEFEIYVFGVDGNKTRYTFRVSVPENNNGH